ncbi:MAG: hypothetical protein OQK81_01820, partial [Candidatus Bathyarchaeota archaeon]|nr:hypothetical protein [Candidatus Bathyarchaeota archaeon]
MSYGHQGLRDEEEKSRMKLVSSARNEKGKIKVTLEKERPMSQCPLYDKYEIQRYDLHPGYSFA